MIGSTWIVYLIRWQTPVPQRRKSLPPMIYKGSISYQKLIKTKLQEKLKTLIQVSIGILKLVYNNVTFSD